MTPILLLGAGRMGGALLAGWKAAGAFDMTAVMVRDPHPGDEAVASGEADPERVASFRRLLAARSESIY